LGSKPADIPVGANRAFASRATDKIAVLGRIIWKRENLASALSATEGDTPIFRHDASPFNL
jgi:hypothetical protein